MKNPYKALVVNKNDSHHSVEVKNMFLEELPEGDVLIKVAYSSINYKDALAIIPNSKIVNTYPFVSGIDLAGTVVPQKILVF